MHNKSSALPRKVNVQPSIPHKFIVVQKSLSWPAESPFVPFSGTAIHQSYAEIFKSSVFVETNEYSPFSLSKLFLQCMHFRRQCRYSRPSSYAANSCSQGLESHSVFTSSLLNMFALLSLSQCWSKVNQFLR